MPTSVLTASKPVSFSVSTPVAHFVLYAQVSNERSIIIYVMGNQCFEFTKGGAPHAGPLGPASEILGSNVKYDPALQATCFVLGGSAPAGRALRIQMQM